MKDAKKQSTEFDAYAVEYQELLRDPIREKFAASNRFFFERKLDVIRAFFKKRGVETQNLDWLDVGCGQGDLLQVGHSWFKSTAGCDPSEAMLKACSNFAVRHQSSEDRLPFDDATFDFVTAVCVFHHVPEDRRVALILEMRRLLRPGGVLCIIEHNPLNPVTRLIVSRSPVDADAHLLRLSLANRLLQSAGMTVLGSNYFLFLPQSLYRYGAFVERGLQQFPLGGQYSVFAQHASTH